MGRRKQSLRTRKIKEKAAKEKTSDDEACSEEEVQFLEERPLTKNNGQPIPTIDCNSSEDESKYVTIDRGTFIKTETNPPTVSPSDPETLGTRSEERVSVSTATPQLEFVDDATGRMLELTVDQDAAAPILNDNQFFYCYGAAGQELEMFTGRAAMRMIAIEGFTLQQLIIDVVHTKNKSAFGASSKHFLNSEDEYAHIQLLIQQGHVTPMSSEPPANEISIEDALKAEPGWSIVPEPQPSPVITTEDADEEPVDEDSDEDYMPDRDSEYNEDSSNEEEDTRGVDPAGEKSAAESSKVPSKQPVQQAAVKLTILRKVVVPERSHTPDTFEPSKYTEDFDWEKAFAGFPKEFVDHVYWQEKNVYSYNGPLVVLTQPVCDFLGEEFSSNFCLFCGNIFEGVVFHMKNEHLREKRVVDMCEEKDVATKLRMRDQLLREGNFFKNNIRAVNSGKGYILPTPMPTSFTDPAAMIHCSSCYTLINKHQYKQHQDTCPNQVNEQSNERLDDEMKLIIELYCTVPPAEKKTHSKTLSAILEGLREKDLCIADHNILNYLIFESIIRKEQPVLMQNYIRSEARKIYRFFEPFEPHELTTTDILLPKNSDALLKRLLDLRVLDESNQNSNASSPTGDVQNCMAMISTLKKLSVLARLNAVKAFGPDSKLAKDHALFLQTFFTSIKTAAQKLRKVAARNKECLTANDKERILWHLRALLKKGMDSKLPPLYMDRVLFYGPFADCLASILWVVYSASHTKDEIKKLLKKDLQKSHLDSDAISKLIIEGGGKEIKIPKDLIKAFEFLDHLKELAEVRTSNNYVFAQVEGSTCRHFQTFYDDAVKEASKLPEITPEEPVEHCSSETEEMPPVEEPPAVAKSSSSVKSFVESRIMARLKNVQLVNKRKNEMQKRQSSRAEVQTPVAKTSECIPKSKIAFFFNGRQIGQHKSTEKEITSDKPSALNPRPYHFRVKSLVSNKGYGVLVKPDKQRRTTPPSPVPEAVELSDSGSEVIVPKKMKLILRHPGASMKSSARKEGKQTPASSAVPYVPNRSLTGSESELIMKLTPRRHLRASTKTSVKKKSARTPFFRVATRRETTVSESEKSASDQGGGLRRGARIKIARRLSAPY